MFSNLGPLFKTVFRQAESTDTRQAIRREEKEQGRGNKEAQEDTHISVNLWEDNTSVSVTSLQAFLIDFLKDKTFSDKADISNQMAPFQTQQQKPQNTFVARATNAYQTMAEQTQKPPRAPQIEEISTADLVESEEVRKIYTLIEDLELLSRKGIDSLYIEKAESFVESLRQAVRVAKSKL
ncbi:MAG: hypothetical protein GW903_06255 [Alphaproteobacteria bacterium]|nr:hypothetical protein [Alphaproteobacteria bacterium]NCQ88483.1 hypothetical protein [Alphaproteobacteria bacterium]NCT06026.1 hypothetical protein [Alphaproteobacteria bacterium]